MLLLAALFWGTTFVAQSEGMDHMGPLTYQAARSVLGGAFLIPVALGSDAIKKKKGTYSSPDQKTKKKTLIVGIICGVILTVSALLQQYGIALGTSSVTPGTLNAVSLTVNILDCE